MRLKPLATQQRRRLVASIMNVLEQELWPHLDEHGQKAVRGKVLSAINAYHDFILDVASVLEEEDPRVELNEHAVTLLRQIHKQVS